MRTNLLPSLVDWACPNAVVPVVATGGDDAEPPPLGNVSSKSTPAAAARHGPRLAMKRFAYRVARRALKLQVAEVMSLDLAELHRRPLEPSPFHFRFLTPDDVRKAVGDPMNDLDAAMADELQPMSNFCFAAFDHCRLACYSWYALGQVRPEHCLGARLKLPDDTVYMYKAFTTPEYRGQRLHEATLHRATLALAARGIRRLVAIVEYAEWASRKSHQRMGCRPIGRLWWLGHFGPAVVARPCKIRRSGLQFGDADPVERPDRRGIA